MGILDRYVIRNFLISYLIIAFVLIGLYVLVDLALQADEFTEGQANSQALSNIASYYGHQVFVYFRELAGLITLVSAVVTLTMMNRRNEMTAILASGVSLYRVIWPVMVMGLVFNALSLVDQELIMPNIADKLVRKHDEGGGLESFPLWFYRMYGAASADDRAQVRAVLPPVSGSAGDARLRLANQEPDVSATVKAAQLLRANDVLAILAGSGPAVRVYVKVQPSGRGVIAAVGDLVNVTVTDVDQGAHNAWPAATAGRLDVIEPGDVVAPVTAPWYQFTATRFHIPGERPAQPDSKSADPRPRPLPDTGLNIDRNRDYWMDGVVIVKRHALTGDPLARIDAEEIRWDPAANQWQLSRDACMTFLSPPVRSYLPTRPIRSAVSPVATVAHPREVVLRNSGNKWMAFMSTSDLKRLSETRGAGGTQKARAIMHIRFTQPIIDMVLLLLGVPFVLSRAPVGLWEGIVKCVLLCGGCFVLSFVFQQLSGDSRDFAVVAAWLPVILFGPLAALMLDSVKT